VEGRGREKEGGRRKRKGKEGGQVLGDVMQHKANVKCYAKTRVYHSRLLAYEEYGNVNAVDINRYP